MLLQKDILFEYIMENCQDIISVKDLNYNYVICNKAFLKHLKLQHESEVLGKNITEILPKESKDIIISNLEKIIQNREPVTFTYKQRKNIIKQTALPIIENCEITGILSVSTDITREESLKFKLMEKICQLNNILEREKNLKSQKEMFFATLTHDLKNPVQALLMTLKMFKDGVFGGLNREQSEILNTAIESSDYMQKMLCSILSAYKLDNGAIELKKTNFYIDELIIKCINENEALAQNRSVKIKYINPVRCSIYADEARIRRVIGNLMNNGISHALKNTEFIIRTEKTNKNLVLSFTNIGYPIPEKVKRHIFEKYVTGSSMTGTGLGLYFSKKVAEAHAGQIYLKTEGDKITFTFEIPLNSKVKSSTINF